MIDKKNRYPALKELPDALKPWANKPQWVAFRLEERNGKITKPPINPQTGEYASVSSPATWATYDQAVEAVQQRNLDGIGIVLTGDLFGIDLDHAITETGEPLPHAVEIIQGMNTYTEISPSGDGYHILAVGSLPPVESRKSKNTELKIEAYQGDRYFTITGNTINNAFINMRTDEAAKICEKYLSISKPLQAKPQETGTVSDILDKARHGANAARFIALYDHGDLSAYNGDHSAATQALVNDLCYWTNGNEYLIDQLFRGSALFSTMRMEKGRNKWDVLHGSGMTYGQRTIKNALRDFKPYEELKVFTAAPAKPQEKKPQSLETYRASDLDDMDLTPTEFIIQDILPTGLTIFAGSQKVGKSFMMLEAACAIAEGREFWGKQTEKGTVLYLDLEGNQRRAKQRFLSMGIQKPKDLHIAHRTTEQLDTGLLTQIEDFISKFPDTKTVIIDTLARVKGTTKSHVDAYTADTRLLAPLQTMALQKDIAVILITHLRKDTGYRENQDPFEQITGSNAQFGVSDTGWLITGKRGEKQKHFLVTGRDVENEADWIIERQINGRWKLIGDTEAVTTEREFQEYSTSPVASTIRRLVPNPGSLWSGTSMELAEEVMKATGKAFVPADIGLQIKKAEPLLSMYDNIRHIAPNPNGGRNGRLHTFKRDNV